MRAYSSKAFFLSLLVLIVPSLTEAKSDCCQTNQKAVLCVSPTKQPSWYFDVGLGWVVNQRLGANYLSNLELAPDTLAAPKASQVPMGLLSGGYVWSRQTNWLPFASLGLEYSYAYPAKVKGVLIDYSELQEANHNYQYKVTHQGVSLLGKVALARWENWLPYVAAGLGASWNRVSNYSEQVISERASDHTNPEFPSKTTLDFSYSLGAGLDYVFTEYLWAGFGYRFDRFGKMGTGDSILHNKLFHEHVSNSLRTHSFIFSLRYFFG